MTQLGLAFMLLTLSIGGVSVDLMRHEGLRASVQQGLDGCAYNLSATALPNATPDALAASITDCLDREGLSDLVSGVQASIADNKVSATANGQIDTEFMQMIGIDSLSFTLASASTLEIIPQAEVVLAFEASAGTNAIAASIRAGANALVGDLLATGAARKSTVALVPYSNGVNLTPALMARYNVTNVSGTANSNCIEFPATVFGTAGLSQTTAFSTIPTVDFQTSTTTNPNAFYSPLTAGTVNPNNRACPAQASLAITPPSTNTTTLSATITNTPFIAGARWDHGMKWATTFLDPATNAAIRPLVATSLADRPLAYDTPALKKVIVFVNRNASGDESINYTLSSLAPSFATGLSTVWRGGTVAAPVYCVLHASRASNPYYFPATNNWSSSCGAGYTRLTWPQVWANLRATWVAYQLYARPLGASNATLVNSTYSSTLASFRQAEAFTAQQTRFLNECAAAKASGMTVYTVAVDAVAIAKPALQSCASSPAHYTDTTSANFTAAMRAIAADINMP